MGFIATLADVSTWMSREVLSVKWELRNASDEMMKQLCGKNGMWRYCKVPQATWTSQIRPASQ